MESKWRKILTLLYTAMILTHGVRAWTGEIHGRVVCDVCADSSIGPEDHVLEGPFSLLIFVFLPLYSWVTLIQ